MDVQHASRVRRLRSSLRDTINAQRAYPTKVLGRAVRHLSTDAQLVALTQDQKQLVLTGLVLGSASIIAVFFPICALPAAIAGLLLGLYGRYATPLRRMALWTIIFSTIGLVLASINVIMLISTYISTYLLR